MLQKRVALRPRGAGQSNCAERTKCVLQLAVECDSSLMWKEDNAKRRRRSLALKRIESRHHQLLAKRPGRQNCMAQGARRDSFLLKESLIEKGGEEGSDDAACWNDAFDNGAEGRVSRAPSQPEGNQWRPSTRLSFTVQNLPATRLTSFAKMPNEVVPSPSATAVECKKATSLPDKSSRLIDIGVASLRKHWQIILFYLCFFTLTSVVFFLIKSIYKDPRILSARFFASMTVVCFVVFLVPFMRGVQGQMYDKLAGFTRFFNPDLHKLLGPLFMVAGTIHGTIWISCTLQSCSNTWCPIEAFAGSAASASQALCVATFCTSAQSGGFPSFDRAFGSELPANLIKRQSSIRSFYFGFACWSLFGTMSVLSLPHIRRRCFELFYYSHHLFVIAIPVFFAHCWTCSSNFSFEARMMVFPCGIACLLYACDKLCNVFARRYTSRTVDFIHYAKGNILELRMRPVPAWPLFHRFSSKLASALRCSPHDNDAIYFAPGAYADIQCPAISALQWHPFTISSNPDADYVSVTIKIQPGGWTEQLQAACSNFQIGSATSGIIGPDGVAKTVSASDLSPGSAPSYGLGVPLTVNLSGPFGAPSIAYQHYDYLIGIGGGIGFTPFMSILKHFLSKKRERAWAGGDFSSKSGSGSQNNVALFYGVCRSFDDVAWWSSLTCEPDFSNLVTSCSVLIKRGAEGYDKNIALPALRASPSLSPFLSPEKSTSGVANSRPGCVAAGRLAVTLFCTGASADNIEQAKAMAPPGVSVRPGRPQLQKVFMEIDRQLTSARIGVFVCGGESLCDSVEAAALAASVGSDNTFVFHKEIFG